MLTGRAAVLGLLTVLGAAAACTGAADDGGDAVGQVAVITAYEPPADAPDFCAALAGATGVESIATAIGALSADTGRVEARLRLTEGIRGFRAVLEEVGADERNARLATALERLVDSLTRALDGPIPGSVRAEISGALDALGRLAQPVCDFPT